MSTAAPETLRTRSRRASFVRTVATLALGLGLGATLQAEREANAAPADPAAPAESEDTPASSVSEAPSDYSRFGKLDNLARALALVEQRYVRPVDGDRLIEAAIHGLVSELDPHTQYLPPREAKILTEDIDGRFGGVGLVVTLGIDGDDPVLDVRDVIPNAPAHEAGVRVGDRVVAIQGKPIAHFADLGEAIMVMRGTPGTTVRFTVRGGAGTERALDLTRRIVDAPAVEVRYLGEGLGVLRLRDFQEASSREVRKGLRELERQSEGPLRGVVLDLRDNGGGLLQQAIQVVDLFVRRGPIVRTRGRQGQLLDQAFATPAGTHADVPLVVLINKASASASEIVAGALQDHDRALIVGERSYGKGSVQTPYRLRDGSILKLTVALYYTPDDRLIQASGIKPDVRVGPTRPVYEDGLPSLDPERADPQHLRPEDFGRPPSDAHVEDETPAATLPEALQAAAADAPLAVAVEHLIAWRRVAPRAKRGKR